MSRLAEYKSENGVFGTLENRALIRKARLFNPEGDFLKIWSFIVVVLLLYTATLMPYKLSFLDT